MEEKVLKELLDLAEKRGVGLSVIKSDLRSI